MRTLISALVLSITAVSAIAARPTDESIRTLFTVMRAESMMNDMYAAIEPAMKQAAAEATAGKALTPNQKQVMDRFSRKIGDLMRTEMSWAKMEPTQIRIYRETFDQSEIDGLIEFYRSPIGQSFVRKLPVVTQRGMIEMQVHTQDLMPKLEALIQEMNSEVNAAK